MNRPEDNPPASASRNADQLRGVGRLAIDGVTGITDLVEAMHAAVLHPPSMIGQPAPAGTRGLTGMIYSSVRGITRLVGGSIDASLAMLGSSLGQGVSSNERDAAVSALNGVLGDHLQASGNPLAIEMQLRTDGQALPLTRAALATALPPPGPAKPGAKLLILVHGLCMNDRQWNYGGHDHGHALAQALGYTPLYLHYNSGLHLSRNGQALSRLIGQLTRAWPVPVEEIVLLGHSMGGMVARSALDHAFRRRLAWSRIPLKVVFLGVPHHGAPLERAGSWVDQLLGLSPYSAPFIRLGQLRSAGIQDLRYGSLRDTDWQDRDGDGLADGPTPLPLPKQVKAYAIAASTQGQPSDGERQANSDGLVPIASALGTHADTRFDLHIPRTRQWVGYGINHLELLGSDAVYQQLEQWLRKPA